MSQPPSTSIDRHTVAGSQAGAGQGPGIVRHVAASQLHGPASGEAGTTAAVVGATGFTGALLTELLVRHPHMELVAVSSEPGAGESVRAFLPRLHTDLRFCAAAEVAGVDAAFVCLPHGEAAPTTARLLEDGARVVDLSADFRLSAGEYGAWYGPHPCPELLPAVYGLTEQHRVEVAGARLVANPGCYPTAALLALLPIVQYGLQDVVIDAKSGVSGAGRTPTERTHFCSVDSDVRAYAVQGHRHYPEIAGPLGAFAGGGPTLTFVPHLVPLQRGIVATIYARVERLPTERGLVEHFRRAYAGERFVHVVEQPPQLKDVVGTNDCHIHATVDERAGRLVLIAAIDNLMKGASGQALQNMNVMLGLPEHEGLV
jgi:N-acetyl-gamma-glutamyl-phosphate reductase